MSQVIVPSHGLRTGIGKLPKKGSIIASAVPAWSNSAWTIQSITLASAFTPNLPPTINPGDLLLAQFAVKNDNADASITMNSAGWTAFPGNPYNGAGTLRQLFWWRLCDGTEDSMAQSVTGVGGATNDAVLGRCHRFTAANGFNAAPIAAISTTAGAATPLTLPTVTPTAVNNLAVVCFTSANANADYSDVGAVTNGTWTQRVFFTVTGLSASMQTSPAASGAISGGSKTLSPDARWTATGFVLQAA